MWTAIRRRARQKSKRQHVFIFGAVLILWSAFLVIAIVRSFLQLPSTLHLSQRCRMSRMWPSYVLYTPPSSSGLDRKYRLFLYREAYPGRPGDADKPKGRPALFIPGNAGSFGQVRSIASSAHHLFASGQGGADAVEVDWWTVDFNEDFSAFHGQTMHEQAEYTNEVIQFLLREYPKVNKVPVLGHSMGGIVARLMLLKGNHPLNSVDTIITLSSPHAYPPVPLDGGVEEVYQQINSQWGLNANTTLLISLSGGILDNQLSSEPASLPLARIWHDETSLSAFTSSLSALWSGVDHLAMMWCDQLRERLARGILRIEGKGMALLERREEWRRALGMEQTTLDLAKNLPVDLAGSSMTVTSADGPLVKTFNVADAREVDEGFEVLTDLSVGLDTSFGPPIDQEAQLRVHLCSYDECRLVPPSAYHLYPPSPPVIERKNTFYSFPDAEERYELPGKGVRRLRFSLDQLRRQHIGQIRLERRRESDTGLIQAGWTEAAQTLDLAPSLVRSLLVPLQRAPDSTSPSRDFIVTGMDSSLLAYDLSIIQTKLSDKSCQSKVAPLLQVQSLSTGDTQYYPSAIPGSQYTLTLHSTSPYMPPSSVGRQGTKFTVMLDDCSRISGVSVDINWRASAGLLLSRYRSMIGSYPLASLTLVASLMWEEWNRGGEYRCLATSTGFSAHTSDSLEIFPSLSESITQYGGFLLPLLISGSALMTVWQKLAASVTSSDNMLSLWTQDMNFGIATSSLMFNATLAFFFLTSAYGITLLVSLLLDGLVKLAASMTRLTGILAGFHAEKEAKGDILHRPRIMIFSMVILTVLIWFIVPIQFVFLVLFLIQFYSAIMSKISAQGKEDDWRTCRANQQKLLLNLYFWLLPFNAPALLIWTRNIIRGYIGALGGPEHNILYVSGFIAISMISSSGGLIQKSNTSILPSMTTIIITAFSIYALAYGIRYTYTLFKFANLLALWVAAIHYKESISKRQPQNSKIAKEDDEVETELLVSNLDLHMTLPESMGNTDVSLPDSLVASLKSERGGYTIDGSKQENAQDLAKSGLSYKDTLLEAYLDTLDEYFALKRKISEQITNGHFQLSKARMHLGRLTSFDDSWDARMKATLKVKMGPEGQLQLERVVSDMEVEGLLIEEKVESSILRKRRGENKDTPSKDEDVKSIRVKKNEKDGKEIPKEGERAKQAYDPLYQFAALPPPSLRQAQNSFSSALANLIGKQDTIGLAQIQRRLDELEEKILSAA